MCLKLGGMTYITLLILQHHQSTQVDGKQCSTDGMNCYFTSYSSQGMHKAGLCTEDCMLFLNACPNHESTNQLRIPGPSHFATVLRSSE